MADFLDAFKRRESSEGSFAEDDDDDEPHQFAREEINHQSDEEDNRKQDQKNLNGQISRPYPAEESKNVREQDQKNIYSSTKNQNKKKDYYLYQGEEKPYESDPEEAPQGQGQKQKRENNKIKKKDPTYVPKGTFYQHDTRGDEAEFAPKRGGEKSGKLKWRHDKFDKGYKNSNVESGREAEENPASFSRNKKDVVYYVVKGSETKPAEETQQQQQQQSQRQQQPREDRPQQQSKGEKGGYRKGDSEKGGEYGREKGRNYQNSGKYVEYVKRDNYKNPGGKTGGANQDVYYEYVPKKQV